MTNPYHWGHSEHAGGRLWFPVIQYERHGLNSEFSAGGGYLRDYEIALFRWSKVTRTCDENTLNNVHENCSTASGLWVASDIFLKIRVSALLKRPWNCSSRPDELTLCCRVAMFTRRLGFCWTRNAQYSLASTAWVLSWIMAWTSLVSNHSHYSTMFELMKFVVFMRCVEEQINRFGFCERLGMCLYKFCEDGNLYFDKRSVHEVFQVLWVILLVSRQN